MPPFVASSRSIYFLLVDVEGNILYANDYFRDIFPGCFSELGGKPILDATHPEDLPVIYEMVAKALQQPLAPQTGQLRKISAEGKYFVTQWEFVHWPAQDQKPAHLTCTGYDITTYARQSQQADHYARRAERLIEHLTDSIYVLDDHYRVIQMNSLAERLFEVKKEEWYGRSIHELLAPEAPVHLITAQAVLNRQMSISEQYEPCTQKWFRIVVYPSVEDITVHFRDITDEHTAKAKLIDSENKLRAILDSSYGSYVLISPDMKVLSFNKIAYEGSVMFFGKGLAEGDDFHHYIMKADVETFMRNFEQALAGQMVYLEREIIGSTGASSWFAFSYTPVYDQQGHLLGVSFNANSIQEQKEASLRMQEQNKRLREIAWIQSHDVRRPVATLLGLIEVLRMDFFPPEKSQFLDYIRQSAKELDAVIHRIVMKANELDDYYRGSDDKRSSVHE